MNGHVLDRPVWAALTGAWRGLALGQAGAWRLSPEHGPFAATADGTAEAVVPHLPRGRDSWFVEPEPVAAPPGFTVTLVRELTQMVAEDVPPPLGGPAFVPLGEADAAEMQALAALTRPGPLLARTHELGRFIGYREDGRLLAMAGTRMAAPGYIELSGVCTHPDAQGRGLAAEASRRVAAAILAGDARPFLHAYPDNAPAVGLYEALGFRHRARLILTVLSPG